MKKLLIISLLLLTAGCVEVRHEPVYIPEHHENDFPGYRPQHWESPEYYRHHIHNDEN